MISYRSLLLSTIVFNDMYTVVIVGITRMLCTGGYKFAKVLSQGRLLKSYYDVTVFVRMYKSIEQIPYVNVQ